MSTPKKGLTSNDFIFRVCEVWKGLPLYKFELATLEKGKRAKVADSPGIYVWIPPSTLSAIESGKPYYLAAFGSRRGEKTCFPWVEAYADITEARLCAARFAATAEQ